MVQAARLLGIVLIIQSCYTGESAPTDVTVKIEVNYTAPSTFDREPPYYRAGVPLGLNCTSSLAGRGFYHWTSTCRTSFVEGLEPYVSTDFLRSTDNGTHTCTVKGSQEERGSANITVHVVGAGIYDSFHKVALPNNSLILAGRNLDFICVSGSLNSNVGDVYDNNGTDITISQDDPFFTFQRTTGAIHVKSAHQFTSYDQGIYTCRIPDETGEDAEVHVGLYPGDTDVKLAITKMEIKAKEVGLYTVNCISTHSPATSVTWTRDGDELDTSDSEGMYTSYQEVKEYNRRSSTYHNVLTIRGVDVTGRYRCDVENRYKKTSATTVIHELEVTGHETPLIVGITRHIRCTSFGNTTIMMWYKSISRTMATSGDSPNLNLTLTPDDTSLNNTAFTCKAWSPDYNDYVPKVVLIQVREFINNVSISGPPGPWHTDKKYTLTCSVFADVTPNLKWLDPSGNDVVSDHARAVKLTVSGKNYNLSLEFNDLNTSHAGRYTCKSNTVNPSSDNSSCWDVTIKFPRTSVNITSAVHYAGLPFNLNCSSLIDDAVVTDVTVNHTWYKRSSIWARWTEIKNIPHITVSPVMGQRPEFYSLLQFSPLHKKDGIYYYCNSTISASPDDPKLKMNWSISEPFKISPILKTKIVINYDAPDLFPDYAHPDYRAASSVTLNCTTMGEVGTVYYRWSSNCSSCFVTSRRSMTVTRDFLRTRDMGNHTCTATASTGVRGSDSTHMNIISAGIYVEKAQYYYGTQRAQPNNTHLSIYSGPRSNGTSYSRFVLWCCSNSPESYVGSITDPNGITYTRNFKDLRVYRYSRGSTYGGCIRLEGYRHYYYSLNYDSGVYTCTIPDASGKNHTLHFGLYNNGTQNVPIISRCYHHVDNYSVLTLTCETRNALPTEITWLKHGVDPTEVDDVLEKTQTVTDRNTSTYINTISINDTLDGHIATYTVIVGNFHGSVQKHHSVEGIKVTPSEGEILNGTYDGDLSDAVTFDCSSDLFPLRIEWYRNGSRLMSQTNGHAVIDIVSTDHHEEEYKCIAVSSMETQEVVFRINVRVPSDEWATVEIADLNNREPLHEHDHTLTCTVTVDPGLNIEPVVHWYHPDGTPVGDNMDERVTEGSQNRSGRVTKRVLYFSPVWHDDGGDYTCEAEVNVPWMSTLPQNATYKLNVTTQAKMQLRIESLPHCSTWEYHKAYYLERSILKNIERVVREECNCDFDYSEIHSGEFSCRTKRDAVTYRAIINGSSAILSANETRNIIDEWKTSDGTMRHHNFRLQLTSSCPIKFKSFSEPECTGDDEKRDCDNQKGDLLFNSNTCYTFKSCDDGMDEGSA